MHTRVSEVVQDATRTDFGHRVVLILSRLTGDGVLAARYWRYRQ
jgi:hypothetical protein